MRRTILIWTTLAIAVLTGCASEQVSSPPAQSCAARVEFEGRTYEEYESATASEQLEEEQRNLVGEGRALGCESNDRSPEPAEFKVYSVGTHPVAQVIYVEPAYGLMRVSTETSSD